MLGKIVMRVLLSLVLLVGISSAAGAQAIQRIEIAEPGIYRAEKKSSMIEPGAAGGTRTVMVDPTLVEATNTISANVGVHFGFRYRTFGSRGALATLKFVTLLPQPGIRDPKTGIAKTRSEYLDRVRVGETRFKGFIFDHSWEIVTGNWTFEIWDGDRKLGSQSFNVVATF